MATTDVDLLGALRADLTEFIRGREEDTATLAAEFFAGLDDSMYAALALEVALPALVRDARHNLRSARPMRHKRAQNVPWFEREEVRAAAATMKRERLEDHVPTLEDGTKRCILDCSEEDVRGIARAYFKRAADNGRKGQQYESLADLLANRGASTVADVNPSLVEECLFA